MSIFDTLKKDWSSFEGVVVKEEKIVTGELAKVFGASNVDKALTVAEAVLTTELGKLASKAVPLVEQFLSNAAGSVKLSTAGKIVASLAEAAGLDVSKTAIDSAIQALVPFIASTAIKTAVGVVASAAV